MRERSQLTSINIISIINRFLNASKSQYIITVQLNQLHQLPLVGGPAQR